MYRRRTILALPADTHGGSPLGLIPPGQWQLENGGYYTPNTTQRILLRLWDRAWERIAEQRKAVPTRLIVAHVGDAVEGIHHQSTEIITARVDEHERIHIAAMERGLSIAGYEPEQGDCMYYIKGTAPTHVGPGGGSEERIARNFDGVVPALPSTDEELKDGRYLHDRLRISINDKLFDLAHHGGNLGTRPWTRLNPLRSILQGVYYSCLESTPTVRFPDYWIRAHKHQSAFDIYPGANGHTIHGYITPAFQSKTEFAYKIAADKPAHIGMIWFAIEEDGTVIPYDEKIVFEPDDIRVV